MMAPTSVSTIVFSLSGFGNSSGISVSVAPAALPIPSARWPALRPIVITMGRKAGHLALGIGKAAGATLTLIPEEFPKPLRLKTIVDTLVGAIIKRLSYGRRDGVAMIAEGVVLDVDPNDLSALHEVERDAHGHIRIAEVNIGEILKV